MLVGDTAFMKRWDAFTPSNMLEAKKKLSWFFDWVKMEELNGSSFQTKQILNHFSPDLAPGDYFWCDFAFLVRLAFPEGLSGNDTLSKLTHQFRYIIDAQQVDYIRTNYAHLGNSDEKKLAAYCANIPKDWHFETSRLHQKTNSLLLYPGGTCKPNIKITLNHKFHSEFILDSNGNFLYVLDTNDTTMPNSIINGASFNYATRNDCGHPNSLHEKYDIKYAKNDPLFRTMYMKKNGIYHAPQKRAYAHPISCIMTRKPSHFYHYLSLRIFQMIHELRFFTSYLSFRFRK